MLLVNSPPFFMEKLKLFRTFLVQKHILLTRTIKNKTFALSSFSSGPSEVSPKQKSVSSSSSARETRISLLLMGLALLFVATVGLGNILQDYVFKGANTYAVEQVLSIMNVGYAINR